MKHVEIPKAAVAVLPKLDYQGVTLLTPDCHNFTEALLFIIRLHFEWA